MHALGARVDRAGLRVVGVAHKTELGGEKRIPAPPAQRAADQLLVGVRAVRVGGVEEVHALIQGVLERGERLGIVMRAVELAHAHAAEAEG